MKTLKPIAALAAPMLVMALLGAARAADPRPGGQGPTVSANPAPTAEQIQSLIARMVENQHRNDRAIVEYERVEHVVLHKDGENSEVVADRIERVLPSGTGTMRLQTAQSSPPVSAEVHRHQLQYAVTALDRFLHPSDHEKQDLAKFEKRRREHAELIGDAAKAFRITWGGREARGSRTLAKLLLDPDPNFKPTSRLAADITSDIAFGGGIVGKVYHGGHFVMEQSEVDPGVWLPTLYIYDVDGRKFLLGFGVHERTDVSHYRHLGPPSQ